jgi:D-alanyl-D-alanine dipeptidase
MKKVFMMLAVGAVLTGCQTPFSDERELSWTDEHLANAEAKSAPEYVAEITQSDDQSENTQTDVEKLLEARDEVLNAGAEFDEFGEDSEAYAAEARARAQPPSQ